MYYSKQEWSDGIDSYTSITPEKMNSIEEKVYQLHEDVSPYVVARRGIGRDDLVVPPTLKGEYHEVVFEDIVSSLDRYKGFTLLCMSELWVYSSSQRVDMQSYYFERLDNGSANLRIRLTNSGSIDADALLNVSFIVVR